MRVHLSTQNQQFLQFVQSLTYQESCYGFLHLPSYINRVDTVNSLCTAIYPLELLRNAPFSHEFFKGRSILPYRNDTVTEFNSILIAEMPGQMHLFHSTNSVDLNNETN